MANDRVTLDLQSEGSDEVSLATFADAIARLSKLVEALSEEVAEGSEVRWMTTPFVTAQGLGDLLAVESAASAFLEVGRALEDGVEPQFSPAVRDEALGLAGVINGEVKQMCFRNAEAEAIVRAAPAPAEPVPVGLPTAAYGGVQGRVQTLNSQGSLKITLYETLSDRAVTCHLAKGQEDIMRDVWGNVAVVEGLVERDPVTGRPAAVRDVQKVTVVREASPGGFLSARGLIRPVEGSPEPEVTIRAGRDA